MQLAGADDPFSILQNIERWCQARAGLDAHAGDEGHIECLSFRMGQQWFLLPRSSIAEILRMPMLTRVPWAKPWLLGVANIRGTVLPVTDLGLLLMGESSVNRQRGRVISIKHADLAVGLWVEEVQGLQQFPRGARLNAQVDGEARNWQFFVRAQYELSGRRWLLLDVQSLISSDLFKNAANQIEIT
jgi:twitching motility protein PilI